MSSGFSCRCPERAKPVVDRAWFVVQRNFQCSAFNGYRKQYTDRSTVVCGQCGRTGRTQARFVDLLPDAPDAYPKQFRFTRAELPRLVLRLVGRTTRPDKNRCLVGGDNDHVK